MLSSEEVWSLEPTIIARLPWASQATEKKAA
jgi:hypothetical protein